MNIIYRVISVSAVVVLLSACGGDAAPTDVLATADAVKEPDMRETLVSSCQGETQCLAAIDSHFSVCERQVSDGPSASESYAVRTNLMAQCISQRVKAANP